MIAKLFSLYLNGFISIDGQASFASNCINLSIGDTEKAFIISLIT